MRPEGPRRSRRESELPAGTAGAAQATDAGGSGAERSRLEVRCAELERENAELCQRLERAAHSERDARDAVSELPVAWATLDESGVVRACNALLPALLGLEPELPVGLKLEDFVAVPQHVERLREHLAVVWGAPGRHACDIWLRKPGGGITQVRVQSAARRASRCCRMALMEVEPARASMAPDARERAASSQPPPPAALGAQLAGAARTDPPHDRATAATILVVEDESLVRKAVQHYLAAAGYQVLTAGDRAGALRCCEAQGASLDLVLTDLSLEDGSTGPEVIEQIRAHFPNVGVLYMTACPPELLARRGFSVPPGETLEKPFGKGALLERVRKALASARSRRTD